MRWEYEEPEKNYFISNGKTLWNYTPEDNSVMIGKQTSNFDFLTDMQELKKKFNVLHGEFPLFVGCYSISKARSPCRALSRPASSSSLSTRIPLVIILVTKITIRVAVALNPMVAMMEII